MQLLHLGSRFIKSLSNKHPPLSDADWVSSFLTPSELLLWETMPAADQRHSVEVARKVDVELGDRSTSPILAAAALHDVGKTRCGFGTFGRTAATVVWAVLPDDRAASWRDRSGTLGRLARYRLHPELGAELLDQAGSDPLTVSWTAEHHLGPEYWSVEKGIAAVLKRFDDD